MILYRPRSALRAGQGQAVLSAAGSAQDCRGAQVGSRQGPTHGVKAGSAGGGHASLPPDTHCPLRVSSGLVLPSAPRAVGLCPISRRCNGSAAPQDPSTDPGNPRAEGEHGGLKTSSWSAGDSKDPCVCRARTAQPSAGRQGASRA